MRNWAKIELFWARIQNVPKVIQKRHNRHPHPKIPHISGITEQNRPTIGDYSLGRNWAKIEPFWARIQIQNVPKVTQKCQKWIVHPIIPHISGITEQNQPKIGDYSLGRNWAKIEPFWARIRIPNVPKVTQKCQKWIVHPKIPHISRITEQIKPVLQLGQELG